jgi:hypothetical protein
MIKLIGTDPDFKIIDSETGNEIPQVTAIHIFGTMDGLKCILEFENMEFDACIEQELDPEHVIEYYERQIKRWRGVAKYGSKVKEKKSRIHEYHEGAIGKKRNIFLRWLDKFWEGLCH